MFEQLTDNPTRRRMLWIAPLAMGGIAAAGLRHFASSPDRLPDSATGDFVEIAGFSKNGERTRVTKLRKIVRSDADWWVLLTPDQFYVTRKHSTDAPFTGTYHQLHQKGLYGCICCATVLFRSNEKYDSGTGWPSFWAPAAKENVRTSGDPKETLDIGIEVLCKRCDAHLGHIFNDGPEPTGLRYCINESSLKFAAA